MTSRSQLAANRKADQNKPGETNRSERGRPPTDAEATQEVAGDEDLLITTTVVFNEGNNTLTLLDPAIAENIVHFRSISGTLTFATTGGGTVETASLVAPAAQTMGPRAGANGYFNL